MSARDIERIAVSIGQEVRSRNRVGRDDEKGSISPAHELAATCLILEALAAAGYQIASPGDRVVKAGEPWPADAKFQFGDRVTKISGSSWTGAVCGWYRSSLTSIGYCVESEYEPGSVQIYPERAIRALGGAS